MGIGGLNTFMEENYRWLSLPIGSIKRLVIDGSNLSCKLCYRHEWVQGGDYSGIYKEVRTFFDKLQKLSIVVILDGINKEEKTVRERQERRFQQIQQYQSDRSADSAKSSILPLLARLVFADALQDAGVPFYIVDGEADTEIVAVANFYGCPVLTDDSDFYIFNVKGGYIPLQHFLKALRGEVDVRVYNTTTMAKQFNLQDPDLRLLVPAILGNNFMKRLQYQGLDNPKAKTIFQSISRCLSVKQFLDSVPDRADIHENYCKAAKLYNVKLERNPAELSEVTSLDVPKWILERYRKGCFGPQMMRAMTMHKCILPLVVDDMRSKCAQHVGLRIRRCIYGILNSRQPVQESVRDNGTPPHLTDREIHCLELKPPLSLGMICGLTITKKVQILCSVLHCYQLVDFIPPEWQLVIASCIYWYKKAKPTPTHHLLRALIHCLIVCHDGHMESQIQYLAPRSNESFLETLHAYAQWQCTYCDAVALNQLLMEPFEYVSPAHLYSGKVAMHYAVICSRSETCQLTGGQRELYHHLMQPFSEMPDTTAGARKQPQMITQIKTFSDPNPFALLQNESHSKKSKK